MIIKYISNTNLILLIKSILSILLLYFLNIICYAYCYELKDSLYSTSLSLKKNQKVDYKINSASTYIKKFNTNYGATFYEWF